VRGLLLGITGLLGAAAFWRRRQRRQLELLPARETGPDPAEELRAKLAESRAPAGEEPAAEASAAAAPDADVSPLDPETRRRSVHERARASIDELH
jgi:hypothetical protein